MLNLATCALFSLIGIIPFPLPTVLLLNLPPECALNIGWSLCKGNCSIDCNVNTPVEQYSLDYIKNRSVVSNQSCSIPVLTQTNFYTTWKYCGTGTINAMKNISICGPVYTRNVPNLDFFSYYKYTLQTKVVNTNYYKALEDYFQKVETTNNGENNFLLTLNLFMEYYSHIGPTPCFRRFLDSICVSVYTPCREVYIQELTTSNTYDIDQTILFKNPISPCPGLFCNDFDSCAMFQLLSSTTLRPICYANITLDPNRDVYMTQEREENPFLGLLNHFIPNTNYFIRASRYPATNSCLLLPNAMKLYPNSLRPYNNGYFINKYESAINTRKVSECYAQGYTQTILPIEADPFRNPKTAFSTFFNSITALGYFDPQQIYFRIVLPVGTVPMKVDDTGPIDYDWTKTGMTCSQGCLNTKVSRNFYKNAVIYQLLFWILGIICCAIILFQNEKNEKRTVSISALVYNVLQIVILVYGFAKRWNMDTAGVIEVISCNNERRAGFIGADGICYWTGILSLYFQSRIQTQFTLWMFDPICYISYSGFYINLIPKLLSKDKYEKYFKPLFVNLISIFSVLIYYSFNNWGGNALLTCGPVDITNPAYTIILVKDCLISIFQVLCIISVCKLVFSQTKRSNNNSDEVFTVKGGTLLVNHFFFLRWIIVASIITFQFLINIIIISAVQSNKKAASSVYKASLSFLCTAWNGDNCEIPDIFNYDSLVLIVLLAPIPAIIVFIAFFKFPKKKIPEIPELELRRPTVLSVKSEKTPRSITIDTGSVTKTIKVPRTPRSQTVGGVFSKNMI